MVVNGVGPVEAEVPPVAEVYHNKLFPLVAVAVKAVAVAPKQ